MLKREGSMKVDVIRYHTGELRLMIGHKVSLACVAYIKVQDLVGPGATPAARQLPSRVNPSAVIAIFILHLWMM